MDVFETGGSFLVCDVVCGPSVFASIGSVLLIFTAPLIGKASDMFGRKVRGRSTQTSRVRQQTWLMSCEHLGSFSYWSAKFCSWEKRSPLSTLRSLTGPLRRTS